MGKSRKSRAEVSRKNGSKSRGPKTQQGKERSRKNSVKHGLLSSVIVLGKFETREEFDKLLEDLTSSFEPKGKMEEILVEEIAVCYWRLRRAITAERGEIHKVDRFVADQLLQKQIQQCEVERVQQTGRLGLTSIPKGELEHAQAVKVTSMGVGMRLGLLTDLLSEVNRQSYFVDPPAIPVLFSTFLECPDWVAHLKIHNDAARIDASNKESKSKPGTTSADEEKLDPYSAAHLQCCQESLTGILMKRIGSLEAPLPGLRAYEQLMVQFEEEARRLPDSKTLDKILRYETTIKKQLYRAMDQLERMQRRRLGEFVPAPAKLAVSTERD
jgi:hypothetical protein